MLLQWTFTQKPIVTLDVTAESFKLMAKIFISYRRDDSRASVGRLYDILVRYFEKNEIFMDVYTIQSGEDFVTAIEREVSSCDTLIAVIGPRWLDIQDEQGVRRITKPSDYVRLEIAAALKRPIHVIPALVERASMPSKNDLPDDLASLTRCNAIELSHERFAYDVGRLVQSVGGAYGKIGIHLGETYHSMVKTRVLDHNITFEIQVDLKKVGQIKGPSLNFSGGEPPEQGWKPLLLRVEAGVHNLSVIYRRSEFEMGTRSKEVSFQLKGGQILEFMIERETSSIGHAKIIIKPYKSIVNL